MGAYPLGVWLALHKFIAGKQRASSISRRPESCRQTSSGVVTMSFTHAANRNGCLPRLGRRQALRRTVWIDDVRLGMSYAAAYMIPGLIAFGWPSARWRGMTVTGQSGRRRQPFGGTVVAVARARGYSLWGLIAGLRPMRRGNSPTGPAGLGYAGQRNRVRGFSSNGAVFRGRGAPDGRVPQMGDGFACDRRGIMAHGLCWIRSRIVR